jgi:uncharacterized protein (DUF2141 family)
MIRWGFVSFIAALAGATALSCAHHPPTHAPSTAPASGPATQNLATLYIDVTDLRNRNGQLLLCVFNRAYGFPADRDKAVTWQIRPARPPMSGPIHFRITLPPGDYAVAVVHDENANGKLDTGAPSEGYGASNNPKPQFRAPWFQEAKFTLPAEGMRITVALRYL